MESEENERDIVCTLASHKLIGRLQSALNSHSIIRFNSPSGQKLIDIKENIQAAQYLFEEYVEDVLLGKYPKVLKYFPEGYFQNIKGNMPIDWLNKPDLDYFIEWIKN